ncbi:MAG: PRC-barrel domain-containing protein [Actinomycetota bacterium]
MQLSELLGLAVQDSTGQRLGTVIDVRLAVDGALDDRPGPPRLFGVVISPRTRSSFLGYERSQLRQPAALAALLRWRHRGTFLALWNDLNAVNADGITMRQDYRRYSAILQTS